MVITTMNRQRRRNQDVQRNLSHSSYKTLTSSTSMNAKNHIATDFGEDDSEELLAVATTVAQDVVVVHLDKDLSAHQLWKVVCQISISNANLTKMQCQYHLLETSQEMGTISCHDNKDTLMPCQVINAIFHHDFIDGFLSCNDGRSRAVQEMGNGSQFQRF